MGHIRIFNRFATRMIAAFVAVILFPAVFTSASFYLVSNGTVKSNVRASSVQIARQAADSLSFILNAGSDVSDLVYSDLKIQNVVGSSGDASQNLKAWRENERYLESFLNNIVYSSSFVNIVYVIKNREESWGSGTFSRIKLSRYDLDGAAWTREAKTRDGGLVWLGLQEDRFSGGGDSTELVLPIARALKDFDTMRTIGYVLVNLNGRKILDNISSMKLGATGGFFVVDGAGRIMVDADRGRIGATVDNAELLAKIKEDPAVEFEFASGGVPYYGVKQRLSNGWLIVGTVPIHEITDKLDALHHQILFSFGAFTLAGILIGLVIAGRVTRPVKQLTRQMKLVQLGDLSARTHVLSHDEFGLMSRQFNRMIADVERLMAQVSLEQRQKQDAELRAVAHRINPHFLFNTLGTLRWLVKYGQSERAYEGISALIRLLEANMGKEGNFVTVAEELGIIEKYLAILELRYSRKFRLNAKIEPGAASFVIPRMLVQPLVENAIFHGIVPKESDGEIAIEARRLGEAVELVVRDDGVGLPPAWAEIDPSLSEKIRDGWGGIGLRHVVESVDLYYGRGSGVTIGPAEGGGTVVRVVLYPKAAGQEGEAYA
ncbi:sensor histidine kinase [Cohnella sp. REN36]|uniref:sensor histidine kinase n=1 Tax=Cohnella sp. REN36 TaxID=2887347 RepID=UPI001D1451AE|nr:sensor histidine kinase [Cohnella sp. REN36]MCC3377208.1 sensor histidine kinase [Cohnella sp. REN36]